MVTPQSAAVYVDFNGLAALKQQARQESPEALKEAAKQFESLFLGMILKNARQAKLADDPLDSQQARFYREMYDQQLALHLAGESRLGLADLIVKQLGGKDVADSREPMDLPRYRENPAIQLASYRSRIKDESNVDDATSVSPADMTDLMDFVNLTPPPSPAPTGIPIAETHVPDLPPVMPGGDGFLIEALPLAATAHSERATPPTPTVSAPLSSPALEDTERFIEVLRPHAEKAARELGVDANLLLAQAALETGWGRAVIKHANGANSHNLFNIKADQRWQGPQAVVNTLEYENGVAQRKKAAFRSYASYEESFRDYVAFLKENPRYNEALRQTEQPARYIRALQRAGYATDPRYADKVMKIYQRTAWAGTANTAAAT